jgi:hypothetical protein
MTIDRKLRLRLELIAALPEPILLERLRRLSQVELVAFRRRYGIRECRCRSRCKIRQYLHDGTKLLVAVGVSRRLALRQLAALRDDCPSSMFQTHCNCVASRQAVPPIPFSAHQLLAKLLVPEGETAPRPPRTRPNRNRRVQAAYAIHGGRRATPLVAKAGGFLLRDSCRSKSAAARPRAAFVSDRLRGLSAHTPN